MCKETLYERKKERVVSGDEKKLKEESVTLPVAFAFILSSQVQ